MAEQGGPLPRALSSLLTLQFFPACMMMAPALLPSFKLSRSLMGPKPPPTLLPMIAFPPKFLFLLVDDSTITSRRTGERPAASEARGGGNTLPKSDAPPPRKD